MPQITVDYTDELLDSGFDAGSFAHALHEAAVEIAGAKSETCKTQFRASEGTLVGLPDSDGEEHIVVHVTIGLLAGRSEEAKARLAEATLELLRDCTPEGDFVLHASAEVRDLDASYRKFER
ncbi:5-carboxymethyl-2-hydroxymuconate Delta-isomerase [Streptomyces sp. MS06]|uniref:5-carboxymethyl-2-hydroxymuconate Delta-isomerase n=1 Tax=Streptomyces sp. MS06 TaxID=3385974 RepID=UPI0039A04589